MGWYPCCCGPDCWYCKRPPETFWVNFGGGGWSSAEWPELCNYLAGVYAVSTEGPLDCMWQAQQTWQDPDWFP
jgi:hypothetical protein